MVFALVQHHHWSGEYVENLIPFELDVYVSLLQKHQQDLEAAKRKT